MGLRKDQLLYVEKKNWIELEKQSINIKVQFSIFRFLCHFFRFTYKRYNIIFVFVWLTSFSMIICRSIHVATNGIISFFLMAE